MADHIEGWSMWDDTASLQRIIIGMQDVAPDPRQDTKQKRTKDLKLAVVWNLKLRHHSQIPYNTAE